MQKKRKKNRRFFLMSWQKSEIRFVDLLSRIDKVEREIAQSHDQDAIQSAMRVLHDLNEQKKAVESAFTMTQIVPEIKDLKAELKKTTNEAQKSTLMNAYNNLIAQQALIFTLFKKVKRNIPLTDQEIDQLKKMHKYLKKLKDVPILPQHEYKFINQALEELGHPMLQMSGLFFKNAVPGVYNPRTRESFFFDLDWEVQDGDTQLFFHPSTMFEVNRYISTLTQLIKDQTELMTEQALKRIPKMTRIVNFMETHHRPQIQKLFSHFETANEKLALTDQKKVNTILHHLLLFEQDEGQKSSDFTMLLTVLQKNIARGAFFTTKLFSVFNPPMSLLVEMIKYAKDENTLFPQFKIKTFFERHRYISVLESLKLSSSSHNKIQKLIAAIKSRDNIEFPKVMDEFAVANVIARKEHLQTFYNDSQDKVWQQEMRDIELRLQSRVEQKNMFFLSNIAGVFNPTEKQLIALLKKPENDVAKQMDPYTFFEIEHYIDGLSTFLDKIDPEDDEMRNRILSQIETLQTQRDDIVHFVETLPTKLHSRDRKISYQRAIKMLRRLDAFLPADGAKNQEEYTTISNFVSIYNKNQDIPVIVIDDEDVEEEGSHSPPIYSNMLASPKRPNLLPYDGVFFKKKLDKDIFNPTKEKFLRLLETQQGFSKILKKLHPLSSYEFGEYIREMNILKKRFQDDLEHRAISKNVQFLLDQLNEGLQKVAALKQRVWNETFSVADLQMIQHIVKRLEMLQDLPGVKDNEYDMFQREVQDALDGIPRHLQWNQIFDDSFFAFNPTISEFEYELRTGGAMKIFSTMQMIPITEMILYLEHFVTYETKKQTLHPDALHALIETIRSEILPTMNAQLKFWSENPTNNISREDQDIIESRILRLEEINEHPSLLDEYVLYLELRDIYSKAQKLFFKHVDNNMIKQVFNPSLETFRTLLSEDENLVPRFKTILKPLTLYEIDRYIEVMKQIKAT